VRIILALTAVCLCCISYLKAQESRPLPLMPMPARMQIGTGHLLVDPSFTVAITGHGEARLQRAVEIFLDQLRNQTGMTAIDMNLIPGGSAILQVQCESGTKEIQELGEDESYTLEITSSRAKLDAQTTLGAMRGLQTLLQLVHTGPSGFAVPAITIQDKPRFAWRGLLIDVARHYIPVEVLKRNLDGMARVKLNVLHLHLSDNQGFRVESKKFPKLQEMGSDGHYYTQEQIRDLIAYARERGIRIVPEFDMPGHSTAWFVGYPKLASSPGPFEIDRQWGVLDAAMDPTQEYTYKFLNEFVAEMAKLFPEQFFHIGGDEVNGKAWDANPKIQEFKHAHGLNSNEDLQAYFNKHLQEIVSKHGKTMLGWDEILRPDLPKSIVIQSWRGQESLAQAARQGYRGLLSNGYYLDLMWPAARHYAVDPMSDAAASLTPEQQQLILGGEACMWSEYVSPENIDSRIWPRVAAIAERLWSPQETRDVGSMYARMEEVSQQLDWLGLTHNSGYTPMLRRIAGGDDATPLKVLADSVEPVKDYTREEGASTPATSATPINRLVDASHPESVTARQFSELVDELVLGKARPGTEARIRTLLSSWRDNQNELLPLLEQSFLLKEVGSISQTLSALGGAGLAALDYLDRGEQAPTAWVSQQLALIEQAKKPQAQVLLVTAPAVQKLVEASGNPHLVTK
jgi:hexosaminidase